MFLRGDLVQLKVHILQYLVREYVKIPTCRFITLYLFAPTRKRKLHINDALICCLPCSHHDYQTEIDGPVQYHSWESQTNEVKGDKLWTVSSVRMFEDFHIICNHSSGTYGIVMLPVSRLLHSYLWVHKLLTKESCPIPVHIVEVLNIVFLCSLA